MFFSNYENFNIIKLVLLEFLGNQRDIAEIEKTGSVGTLLPKKLSRTVKLKKTMAFNVL